MSAAPARVFRFVPAQTVQQKLTARAAIEMPIVIKAMKDVEFRKALIANPRAVLEQEFSKLLGKAVKFPDNFNISVVEETDNMACLVIPRVPITPGALPSAVDLDPDAGVAHYCTTVGCKPGWSC
jgi:hypothetical protein